MSVPSHAGVDDSVMLPTYWGIIVLWGEALLTFF